MDSKLHTMPSSRKSVVRAFIASQNSLYLPWSNTLTSRRALKTSSTTAWHKQCHWTAIMSGKLWNTTSLSVTIVCCNTLKRNRAKAKSFTLQGGKGALETCILKQITQEPHQTYPCPQAPQIQSAKIVPAVYNLCKQTLQLGCSSARIYEGWRVLQSLQVCWGKQQILHTSELFGPHVPPSNFWPVNKNLVNM